MEFDAYQLSARRTLNPALDADARLLDAAAGLAEEAGEILGAVRKHLYQQRPLDREGISRELGDALWCLSTLASALDLSLGDVAHINLEKLRRRHPGGFTAASAAQRSDETPAEPAPDADDDEAPPR